MFLAQKTISRKEEEENPNPMPQIELGAANRGARSPRLSTGLEGSDGVWGGVVDDGHDDEQDDDSRRRGRVGCLSRPV